MAAALGGVPLFALIAGAALAGLALAGIDPAVAALEFNRLGSLPTLTALPLFAFAGLVLAESRAPRRFLLLARALFGRRPGGMAVAVVVVSAGFTAFTGASGVTIIALGGLLLPAMLAAARVQGRRHPERHAIGLIAAGGVPGLLLPPSLAVIVYAITAEVSVDRLFQATAVPGLLLVASLTLYATIARRRSAAGSAAAGAARAAPAGPTGAAARSPGAGAGRAALGSRAAVRRAARAVRLCGWELPLPAAVVGGIYLGAITVTEAATLTAAYVLAVEVLIRREIDLRRDLPGIVRNTGALVGAILLVVGAALALTNVLVDAQAPQRLLAAVTAHIEHPLLFLLALNGVLLVAGMLVDIFSAIVVLVPLIVPVAAALNIDPLHLGVVFLVNLEVGYLTPPVGINLFVARFRFARPLTAIYRAALPFALVLIAALLLITYLPPLSLFLPRLLGSH
ncbi:MAG: TRAP transporter large permease subunit [Spirochaetaceae bacterium]|nr:TRAP transporter large permease subunit [Spirochaetaceae bacterium]